MIETKQTNSGIVLEDQSADLGQPLLSMVRAAMAAGLTAFTTPTPDDGQGRIEWKVRHWVTLKNGAPAIMLVAYKEANAHYEILGPEVTGVAQDGPHVGVSVAAPQGVTPAWQQEQPTGYGTRPAPPRGGSGVPSVTSKK